MKINLELTEAPFRMVAKGKTGYNIVMDKIEESTDGAVSPMELVLMALSGCNSIDVLHILQKQRANIKKYSMETKGKRIDGEKQARPFSEITMHFNIECDAEEDKVRKAIEMSLDKYCSVSKSLNADILINYHLEYKKI